jgi:DNA mismatch repair ATPase MutL
MAFGDNVGGLKPMAEVVLNFIKPQLEDEFRRKEAIAERNRRNGAKHVAKQQTPVEQGDLNKPSVTQENPDEPKGTQENPKNPVAYLASKERKEAKERDISNTKSDDLCLWGSDAREGEVQEPPKPKAKRTRKSDKDPEAVRLNSEARELFKRVYLEKYGSPYVWGPADAGQMANLLSYIRVSRSERKTPLPIDTDSMLQALEVFLNSINDTWVLGNFSVKVIASKYNEIISRIKSQRQYGTKHDPKRGAAAPDPSNTDYYGEEDTL